MTSSALVRLLYIAILTVSVERIRADSALPSSSSADRKEADSGVETDNDDLLPADEDKSAVTYGAADKRKWGENTMMAWGKRSAVDALTPRDIPCRSSSRDRRRWGEKSMSVWGKRNAGGGDTGCEEYDVSAAAPTEKTGKRKWGEKTMQVWGKRLFTAAAANEEEATEDGDETNVKSQKRKWGEKSMSAWGKRQRDGADEEAADGVKRKWGSNSMTVWGKREQLLRNEDPAEDWSHMVARRGTDFDTEINDIVDDVGKLQEHKLATTRLNEYGAGNVLAARLRGWYRRHGGAYWGPKRKWETNTLKVWGKRTPGESDWRGVRTVDAE